MDNGQTGKVRRSADAGPVMGGIRRLYWPLATLAAIGVSYGLGVIDFRAEAADDRPHGITKTYALSGFRGVELNGSPSVSVIQGATFQVSATATPAVLSKLQIRVENGVLRIATSSSDYDWTEGKTARIAITMPSLNVVKLNGSGDIRADRMSGPEATAVLNGSGDLDIGAVTAERVTLKLQGSGDLSASRIDAGSVRLDTNGSGDLEAEGKTRAAALAVNGSGEIDADDLYTDTLTATLNGSGTIKGRSIGATAISGNGSGDVVIVGTPQCTIQKSPGPNVTCGQ